MKLRRLKQTVPGHGTFRTDGDCGWDGRPPGGGGMDLRAHPHNLPQEMAYGHGLRRPRSRIFREAPAGPHGPVLGAWASARSGQPLP